MGYSIEEGSIVNAEQNLFGHLVGCKGVVHTSLAKRVFQVYPAAFEVYRKTCFKFFEKDLLGKCHVWNNRVADLYALREIPQLGSDSIISLPHLRSAMLEMKRYAVARNLTVALPYKIGCYSGGASWDDVLPIIEDVFDDYDVVLYRFGAERKV